MYEDQVEAARNILRLVGNNAIEELEKVISAQDAEHVKLEDRISELEGRLKQFDAVVHHVSAAWREIP